jgi:photosystem II stability/assembly factor-like uncharacterized protein
VGNCTWNLYVDVAADGRVWLGGLGVWTSGNRGNDWTDVCSSDVHVDQHAVTFSADGRTWIGNDGGVFVTNDQGASWINRNEGLGTVQFYPGASLHQTDQGFALAGTQDNGTLKYSGSLAWEWINSGDGGFSAIDPTDPDRTWYVSSQYLNIRKTTDAGASFVAATDGLLDANTGSAAFIAPYAMCPSDPFTLIAGSNDVWRTEDAAGWWSLNSPSPLEPDARPARSLVVSAADATCGTYFVAVRDDRLYRTTDGGANWTGISQPVQLINDIALDPSDANTVYLGLGGFGPPRLLKTTRALAPHPTWRPVDTGLPDIPISSVLVDPQTSSVVYAGTDVGVFRSADGGASWSMFMTGHPNVAVFDLVAEPSGPSVISFTHGRGAFRLVSSGPGEASAGPAQITADRGPGEMVTVRYDPGCGATEHAIYWGVSPITGDVSWTGSACGRGSTGITSFDTGTVTPGTFVYFVVVGQDSTTEGSYGRASSLSERPEAVGVGSCDQPQDLSGCSNVL